MTMDIEEAKRRARSGPLVLLARRGLAVVIGIASTFTVARLVDPSVYGLANMAFVIVSFAQVFRDFGLTNAVLRNDKVNQEELSFIFWFNFLMTISLALIIAMLAPAVSRFYDEPIVMWVILVALCGFVLEGIALQHRAMIGRDLRFGQLALIESVSMLIGFIVTLALAAAYHNVWAIVAGSLLQSMIVSAGCILMSGWHPSWPKQWSGFGSVLRFGANSSAFSISVFLSNNVANVGIGHLLGSGPLGLYNRANALFSLPTGNLIAPIAQATLPLLAKLRSDPAEYRRTYMTLIRKLSTFLLPGSMLLTFSAVPLTEALMGSNWRGAGFVLAALAPALSAYGVAYSASDLFITQDRASELRKLGLVEMFVRVGAVLIGMRFGLVAIAVAVTLSTLLVASFRLIVGGRVGPVGRRDQLMAILPTLPLGAGAAIGAASASFALQRLPLPAPVVATTIILLGGTSAVLCAMPFPACRAALLELMFTFIPSRANSAPGRSKSE